MRSKPIRCTLHAPYKRRAERRHPPCFFPHILAFVATENGLPVPVSANLRWPAILRYASISAGRSRAGRSRGCLNFALHKLANIAHGDGEIVLSLQVDPELRSVAEITAKAQRGLSRDRAFAV